MVEYADKKVSVDALQGQVHGYFVRPYLQLQSYNLQHLSQPLEIGMAVQFLQEEELSPKLLGS